MLTPANLFICSHLPEWRNNFVSCLIVHIKLLLALKLGSQDELQGEFSTSINNREENYHTTRNWTKLQSAKPLLSPRIQKMTHWSESTQIYNDDMKVNPFESSLNKRIVRFVAGDNF